MKNGDVVFVADFVSNEDNLVEIHGRGPYIVIDYSPFGHMSLYNPANGKRVNSHGISPGVYGTHAFYVDEFMTEAYKAKAESGSEQL